MSLKIFLLGGTKDSINIIRFLKEKSLKENFLKEQFLKEQTFNDSVSPYILNTTTTDYGAEIAKSAGADKVIAKPLPKEEIIAILNDDSFDVLIDATHPFATSITASAIESAKIANIPYIRFERPLLSEFNIKNSKLYQVDSFQEAGKIIANNYSDIYSDLKILHLAGVNTIEPVLEYLDNYDFKNNFYVRVLPVESSIRKCRSLGINGDHIIAIQGTFSKNFNKAIMKEFNADIIITKNSGAVGGLPSKLEAADELGIAIILVNPPKIAELEEKKEKEEEKVIVNDLNQLKAKLKDLLEI